MVRFYYQKTSQVPKVFFKPRKDISDYLGKIRRILDKKNYNFPESFLLLPENSAMGMFSKSGVDLILLLGVGGSSLGAKAVFEALKNKKKLKEILVLDSLNPLFLKRAIEKTKTAKKGKLVVFLVSKSGKTLETIANFSVLLPEIKKKNPQVFIISDQDSVLVNFGKRKNLSVFSLPKKVPGRYSVFSNAGILPLNLAGLNTKELFLGAKMANQICLTGDSLKNPALTSALTIFYHWQKGKNIYSNVVFPPDLAHFGIWYQQLMAESLGKRGKGITPTVTLGTTDFHSLGQLYFEGPRDKLFNFVFVENLREDLKGKKIWQLNKAIFEGLKRAYLKKGLPFTETILPELNEKNLGFLFQMKMIEIIFLAKLMKVNAFNQPGVELYKRETKKILSNK